MRMRGRGPDARALQGLVQNYASMIENFLELGGGFAALMRDQKGFPTDKDRIKTEKAQAATPSSYAADV